MAGDTAVCRKCHSGHLRGEWTAICSNCCRRQGVQTAYGRCVCCLCTAAVIRVPPRGCLYGDRLFSAIYDGGSVRRSFILCNLGCKREKAWLWAMPFLCSFL